MARRCHGCADDERGRRRRRRGVPRRAVPGRALPASATTAPTGGAQVVFDRMSEAQRIGQLFMVGGAATGVGSATAARRSRPYHVGNVILTGRSSAGVSATRAVTTGLQARATSAATAGGPAVRRHRPGGRGGPGAVRPRLLDHPAGADPGHAGRPSTLQADAATWGGQLRRPASNVNLAPVLDTVPSRRGQPADRRLPPRVRPHHRRGRTARHGVRRRAWRQAGVAATVKHFPGLGRVTANTDTSAGVTDTVTTRARPVPRAVRRRRSRPARRS